MRVEIGKYTQTHTYTYTKQKKGKGHETKKVWREWDKVSSSSSYNVCSVLLMLSPVVDMRGGRRYKYKYLLVVDWWGNRWNCMWKLSVGLSVKRSFSRSLAHSTRRRFTHGSRDSVNYILLSARRTLTLGLDRQGSWPITSRFHERLFYIRFLLLLIPFFYIYISSTVCFNLCNITHA